MIDEIPKAFNTPEIRIDCDDDKKFKLIGECYKQKELKKKIIDIDGVRVTSKNGWLLRPPTHSQG